MNTNNTQSRITDLAIGDIEFALGIIRRLHQSEGNKRIDDIESAIVFLALATNHLNRVKSLQDLYNRKDD